MLRQAEHPMAICAFLQINFESGDREMSTPNNPLCGEYETHALFITLANYAETSVDANFL